MYTDPSHLKVSDPGKIEGNTVFTYLEVLATDDDFVKYLPQYKNLKDLEKHYEQGGVGDVLIKKFLNDILQSILKPIREKRHVLENNIEYVYDILNKGTEIAIKDANETLKSVKTAMQINYFASDEFLKEIKEKYN
jgi:tryptophanyl-tRNA synthetase